MTTINHVGNGLSGASGTGSFAGTTSPTFVTPVLGTPTSGTLTNCSGLPIAGTTGYGTGVATALGQNVTGSGGIALANGPTFVTSTITAPSITFSSTSGVIGTTTNNNAAAGSVGEIVSSTIASASALSFTNNTNKDLTSISLTAGDWDVYGNIFYQFSIGASAVYCWISQTSATTPNLSLVNALNGIANSTLAGISAPYFRASLSGTTTIYLSGLASFASGTGTGCGGLFARRIR